MINYLWIISAITVPVDANGTSHPTSSNNSHGHRRTRSSFDAKSLPGLNNAPDMVADVEGNKYSEVCKDKIQGKEKCAANFLNFHPIAFDS